MSTNRSPLRISPVAWIMLAVLVWGIVLAIGAYLFGGTLLWQRASIVLGSALLFVAFWLAMLAHRQRRMRKL